MLAISDNVCIRVALWFMPLTHKTIKNARNLPAFPADHSVPSLTEPIYGHRLLQTLLVLTHTHPPPITALCMSVCVWEERRKEMESTECGSFFYGVCACLWLILLFFLPQKTPMTHPVGSSLRPSPRWHCYDIIATPDPKPDPQSPASQGRRGEEGRGGGREGGRKEVKAHRRTSAGGKVQVILQHLEQIRCEML